MSRWMVENIPPLLLLPGLLMLFAGGSVLAQRLLRRRFPGLAEGGHNDATRFAIGIVGGVYAFLNGFMASALWSQINSEDQRVRVEGAAAMQLARDRTVFDTSDSDRIQRALLNYERAALTEWPMAVRGRTYPEADKALQQVYSAYEQLAPHTEIQRTFLTTSLANLDKVSQARTARVVQAQTDTGPPSSLWAVILLTSGLVIGCAVVYGVEQSRTHYLLVVAVGLLVAANLFLFLQLAHPYVGEIATSSQPLRDVIAGLGA